VTRHAPRALLEPTRASPGLTYSAANSCSEFVHAYNQQSNMDNPDLDVFADTEESIALLNAAIKGDEEADDSEVDGSSDDDAMDDMPLVDYVAAKTSGLRDSNGGGRESGSGSLQHGGLGISQRVAPSNAIGIEQCNIDVVDLAGGASDDSTIDNLPLFGQLKDDAANDSDPGSVGVESIGSSEDNIVGLQEEECVQYGEYSSLNDYAAREGTMLSYLPDWAWEPDVVAEPTAPPASERGFERVTDRGFERVTKRAPEGTAVRASELASEHGPERVSGHMTVPAIESAAVPAIESALDERIPMQLMTDYTLACHNAVKHIWWPFPIIFGMCGIHAWKLWHIHHFKKFKNKDANVTRMGLDFEAYRKSPCAALIPLLCLKLSVKWTTQYKEPDIAKAWYSQ
jgi:hypothetical protein